jgi:hypothetical protein
MIEALAWLNIPVGFCLALSIIWAVVESILAKLSARQPIARRRPKRWLVFASGTAFTLAGTTIFIEKQVEATARNRVLARLAVADSHSRVLVNGRDRANPQPVLDALSRLRYIEPHHTYPDHRLTVEVRDGGEPLRLVLARDSSVLTEYWVFLDESGPISDYEIGRVYSSTFDHD